MQLVSRMGGLNRDQVAFCIFFVLELTDLPQSILYWLTSVSFPTDWPQLIYNWLRWLSRSVAFVGQLIELLTEVSAWYFVSGLSQHSVVRSLRMREIHRNLSWFTHNSGYIQSTQLRVIFTRLSKVTTSILDSSLCRLYNSSIIDSSLYRLQQLQYSLLSSLCRLWSNLAKTHLATNTHVLFTKVCVT